MGEAPEPALEAAGSAGYHNQWVDGQFGGADGPTAYLAQLKDALHSLQSDGQKASQCGLVLGDELLESGDQGALQRWPRRVLADRLQQLSLVWVAASHMHWMLWGLVQCETSSIDFDYQGYAQQRGQQYQLVRQVLQGAAHATPDSAERRQLMAA
jgi:hypothetical protein